MLKGAMHLFNDINIAISNVGPLCKCLIVSEDIQVDPNNPDMIASSILMPPSAAVIAAVDGDAEMFYQIYTEYLLSEQVSDFIAVLLGYMESGGSFSIFVSEDLAESWVISLCNHFMNFYGLHIGIPMNNVEYVYDINFNDSNNNIIYMANLESPMQYLINSNLPFYPDYVLYKLNAELHSCRSNDLNEMNMVYTGIARIAKSNQNTFASEQQIIVSFDPNLMKWKG